MRAAKHDWHHFDVNRGVQVRQATNRLRHNQWEVRDQIGRVMRLDDAEFDRYRAGQWSPWGLS